MSAATGDERIDRINDTIGQLARVIEILKRIKYKKPISETDGMIVRRLIRLLVEEWV